MRQHWLFKPPVVPVGKVSVAPIGSIATAPNVDPIVRTIGCIPRNSLLLYYHINPLLFGILVILVIEEIED